MKIKVNRDACISCGACEAVAEDIFELDEDGISKAKISKTSNDEEASLAKEASESCPTGAIEVSED